VPADFAVTLPLLSTVATAVFEDDQVTPFFVAHAGTIEYPSFFVPPTVNDAVLSTFTDVTGTFT